MKCAVVRLLLYLLWNAHKNVMSEMCIERWSDEPSNNQHFSLWTNNATGYGAWIWIAGCYLEKPHEYESQQKTCPIQMCVIRTPPTSGTLLIGSPDRKCIPIQYTIHSSTDSQSPLSMWGSLRIVASTYIIACNEAYARMVAHRWTIDITTSHHRKHSTQSLSCCRWCTIHEMRERESMMVMWPNHTPMTTASYASYYM